MSLCKRRHKLATSVRGMTLYILSSLGFWSLLCSVALGDHSSRTDDPLAYVLDSLAGLERWITFVDNFVKEHSQGPKYWDSWSPCSKSCGGGFKTRKLEGCRDKIGTGYYCPRQTIFCNPHPCDPEPKFASCLVTPNPGFNGNESVQGTVRFEQASENAPLKVEVDLQGFLVFPNGTQPDDLKHGFHVHELGDITGGCGSAGGHYNPEGVTHGGRTDAVRHAGDFGNIQQSLDGKVVTSFDDPRASLFGQNSIIGRAIVVHADIDDLGTGGNAGSLSTGNAGARLGCCVIGIAGDPNTTKK